jgi:rhodanese-related sulfurtransferase
MTMNPGESRQPTEFLRTVSAEALLQELRSNVDLTIIDVRERPRIRETGAIPNARTYPLSQLSSRLAELSQLRSTRIVVVSQRARRAQTAAVELEVAGFGEVFVLEGGMHRWLELGYPVESRESSPPSVRR